MHIKMILNIRKLLFYAPTMDVVDSPSPLLALPTEIRLQIFTHLFQGTTIPTCTPRYTLTWRESIKASPNLNALNSQNIVLPAVLVANKQIRSEALPLFSDNLTVHLSPLLAHTQLRNHWAAPFPRLASPDLAHFRPLVKRVDMGLLTCCGTCTGAGAEVEDMDLNALTNLNLLKFEAVIGEVARCQFRCSEEGEDETSKDADSFAQVLQEQWCDDEKRCFGLSDLIEHVTVYPFTCGDTWKGQRNRFVSMASKACGIPPLTFIPGICCSRPLSPASALR
jgi:hypothetical protein